MVFRAVAQHLHVGTDSKPDADAFVWCHRKNFRFNLGKIKKDFISHTIVKGRLTQYMVELCFPTGGLISPADETAVRLVATLFEYFASTDS